MKIFVKLYNPLLLIFMVLFSCQKSPVSQNFQKDSQESLKKPIVVTTIAPYEFLLQQLAGDFIEILNTSEQSNNPHVLDLRPQQAIQLQAAYLFLSLNPLEEESILKNLGQQTKVLEMWYGFPLLDTKGAHEHQEEEHGETHAEHDEEGTDSRAQNAWDPHFWLSPKFLPIQINAMANELESLLTPSQKEILQRNKEALLQRNRDLVVYLRSKLSQLQNGKIISFHSSLAYFADFFGAQQIFVESQNTKLGPEEMLHLFTEAQELTFPVLLSAPQFEQESAKILAKQLKLTLLEFNPLQPDIFASLSNLADQLTQFAK